MPVSAARYAAELDQRMFYAHSANPHGHWHPLVQHLKGVGALARSFGEPLGMAEAAALAGYLHDLGKYGERFQRRLQGQERGIDHWSAGAWIAALQFKRPDVAYAILGHHLGLPRADKDSLLDSEPAKIVASRRGTVSDPDAAGLLRRLEADLGEPLATVLPDVALPGGSPGDHIELRMLFSALVDADYLDTEAHFASGPEGKPPRCVGPPLDAEVALAALCARRAALATRDCAPAVREVRERLWVDCLAAAERSTGTFTLTAPTGSGKTLAMMGFALAHARKHGLRRVVVVLPFLSIVEQTARIYQDILGPALGPEGVLEHHSLVEELPQDEDDQHVGLDQAWRRRQRTENWDAPVVVTTSVQALESMFSHRPGRCRKLHRLARSVILFDEVQTLRPGLALPTLATLSRLSSRFGSTVVFATATQPAFGHLDAAVRRWPPRPPSIRATVDEWTPSEIVRQPASMFKQVRRVSVLWPVPGAKEPWTAVAAHLEDTPQALAIVNLTAHAQALAEALPGALHLSTRMCAGHRLAVLAEVRRRLAAGEPCLLVATQCVEAGVDLDFPVVWRSMGPLDAIAQAAGRCNREGRLDRGQLVVFRPEVEGRAYPGDGYEQAASVTELLLAEAGAAGLDIDDPDLHERYFRRFFGTQDLEAPNALSGAVRENDLPRVSSEYRLIEENGLNVLVPWDRCEARTLLDEARADGITGGWLRRARHHAVTAPRLPKYDTLRLSLEPILPKEPDGPWFTLRDFDLYDTRLGLVRPAQAIPWIV